MCGRFALTAKVENVLDYVSVASIEDFPARFNIAPTQPILIVIEGDTGAPGSNLPKRRAMLARWGFMPGWVKDPREFPLLVNARSETAIEKASFRAAMRHRRILIPPRASMNGTARKRARSRSHRPIGSARARRNRCLRGLMETWASADGSEVETACILTAPANPSFAPIHDRMPVVIPPEQFARWLDCKTQEPRNIQDLMVSPPEDLFEAIPVSDRVNKVANTGPDIQDRIAPSEMAVQPKPIKTKAARRDSDGGQMDLF